MLVLGDPLILTTHFNGTRIRTQTRCQCHSRSRSRSRMRKERPPPGQRNGGRLPVVSLTASLFSTGFILGPMVDGLHSTVELVVYRNGAIDIGPLHTNVWVPPLLGLFYVVVGWLQLSLDQWPSAAPARGRGTREKAASSLIALLLFIQLSAQLYKAGTPDYIEAYSLFAAAQLIWLLLDNTVSGFLLASIVGSACPLAEIPLMKLFNLWYYPQPNIEIFGEGLVTWTITCYFVYATFLINLSRYLKYLLMDSDSDSES